MKAVSIDPGRSHRRSVLLLVALAALPVRAVAAAATASDCEVRAIRSQEVLVGASLDNWEPVNDRTVLIWTGHDTRAHLVRLDRPLYGLTAAPIIDLVDGDHDHDISPCGHDGIRIDDGQGDGTIARIVAIKFLSYRRTLELDPGAQVASPHLSRV